MAGVVSDASDEGRSDAPPYTTAEGLILGPRPMEEFPSADSIQHGDVLSLRLSSNTTQLTHGLHRFPAKYIPQVPRWALRNFADESSVVLDPFMGSGTTLVEGLCAVGQSFGVDIDPLARLISTAKTVRVDIQRIATLSSHLSEVRPSPGMARFLPMTGVKNVPHWFTPDAWRDLCSLFDAINSLDCTAAERCFFFCVFSSTVRWVSNADDQTQKTYVSGTLPKTPPPVMPTFRRFLARARVGIESLEAHRAERKASVLDGSALSIPLPEASVDLVVTSPPYLDSVDYMYNFMLEYFWLGPMLGVPSRSEFNLRRRASIGARSPLSPVAQLPSGLADLFDIGNIPGYRRDAVLSYFDLMEKHFIEAARVMKPGARYVLVVGNSQAAAGVIPVHDCLLHLARRGGLHLEKAFGYRIRRHYMKFPRKGRGGIILMDWVITLRRTDVPMQPVENRLPLPHVTIGHDEVAN